MNLFRFLLRHARGTLWFTSLAALLSGACNAGLIAVVNGVLNRAKDWADFWLWGFAGLALGKLATNFASQLLLVRFSQQAIASLRQELCRQILSVPLRKIEEIGAARLMATLTEDILHISHAILSVPGLAVNLAILMGGAVYLCWLSWQSLLGLAVLILVGSVAYRLLISNGFHHLHLAREVEDALFGHFRALTEGIKELKLHRNRRRAFLQDHVHAATECFRHHSIHAETRFIVAHGWGHLLVYLFVGLILFGLPHFLPLNREALTGYVITVLYLMGPLAGLLASFSVFGRARVALRKVEGLGASLSACGHDDCPLSEREEAGDFDRLELRGVTHSYSHEKDDSNFVLGPVNVVFERGEIVFLAGGNGSGKSTLAKTIAGLYVPEFGQLRLNGKPVTDGNRDEYRQLFSAVFNDFYLFESFLGLVGSDLDGRARDYLEQLHLDHKVKVRDGRLSTVALSQGQRKRLALLTAYLEDRPFYIFDEWASDQDPQFKEVFYTRVLRDLKERGKTVLVITHDENYFHLADRILKLDYGRLVPFHSSDGGLEPWRKEERPDWAPVSEFSTHNK